MKWVTRSNIKVDRVACPWLIRRFIDPAAEFLFVHEAQLLEVARRENAIPFDAPRLAEVQLNHRGERCTFEAILEDYHLSDSALHRLGLIVRAADVKGQEHVAPEGLGLRAIAEGLHTWDSPMRSDWPVRFLSTTHCTSTFAGRRARLQCSSKATRS